MGQSPPGHSYNTTGVGLPFFQGKSEFGQENPIAVKWCSDPIKTAEKDDILISVRAPVGPTNLADQKCCIGRGLSAIRINTALADRDYVWRYLQRSEHELVKKGQGSTFDAINSDDLKKIQIPLPPLDHQRRIAARLKAQLAEVETARRAVQVQVKEVSNLIDAIIRQSTNSSDAKTVLLGDVIWIDARIVDPTTPELSPLPHISAENISPVTGTLKNVQSAAEDGMESGKYLFDAGDVLYSKLRPYLRKATTVDFDGLCSADMYPIKFDSKLIDAEYLRLLLVSDEFTSYANEKSARSRMPKLNREQLFAYKSKFPSIDEQRQIAARLKAQLAEVDTLAQAAAVQLAEIDLLPQRILAQAFEKTS